MLRNNFLVNIAFSCFAIIISFLFKAYLASIFPKIELGVYYTLIDIVSIFMIVFVGARSSMVVHFAKTKDETLILNIFRIGLFIIFIIATFFLILFYEKIFHSQINTLFLILFIFSQAIYIYFFNQLGMYRLYKVTNNITIIEPISLLVWFFIIKYFMGLSFEQLLITTICDMFFLSFIIKLSKKRDEPPFIIPTMSNESKKFIKDSMTASFEFFVGMISVYLAVLFFAKYFSPEDLSDFQVVVKPIYFYFLTLFVFPIFKFIFPEISSYVSNNDIVAIKNMTKKMAYYSMGVSLLSILALLNFGEQLVIGFFGLSYKSGVVMLQTLSITFLFVILGGYFMSVLKAFGQFPQTLQIRIYGLLFFVSMFYILNYFLQNPISIIYAFTCGHILITIFLFRIYTKILK